MANNKLYAMIFLVQKSDLLNRWMTDKHALNEPY